VRVRTVAFHRSFSDHIEKHLDEGIAETTRNLGQRMQNLFWKSKSGKVVAATETPFKSEDEFERYIETAKEVLSGITILKRQVRAGGDIPDMVGIDPDNYVVVLENKNVTVDEGILPQIIRYAVWAETHPDAIKAWWFEAKEKPEIDWDRLQIRVVVLAPDIKLTVPRLVKKIGYPVDLIELKKFVVGKDEFVFVRKLEEPDTESKRPTAGRASYDREYYEERKNPHSVETFFELKKEFERIVRSKSWNLETRFTSSGVAFKNGFFNAFTLKWTTSKTIGISVNLPKGQVAKAKKLSPYPIYYEDGWRGIWIEVTDKLKPRKLVPLLQLGYDNISGEAI
jgi:hypothetical protein